MLVIGILNSVVLIVSSGIPNNVLHQHGVDMFIIVILVNMIAVALLITGCSLYIRMKKHVEYPANRKRIVRWFIAAFLPSIWIPIFEICLLILLFIAVLLGASV